MRRRVVSQRRSTVLPPGVWCRAPADSAAGGATASELVKARLWIAAAAAPLAVLIVVLVACSAAPTLSAPSQTPADAALASFNRAFLAQTNGKGYYRLSTGGGQVTFYKQAELIEMTQDAWLRSRNPAYKTAMAQLYKGLLAHSASMSAWLRMTNDDLMWAAVMCLRAYGMTGDRTYLVRAKAAFDATYARSYSPALGGGLWNSFRHRSKNTCVTLPASVAASMLYQSLHDASYRSKATQLYAWVRRNLYDPKTGAVWDHVTPQPGGGMTVDRTTWTYNQGIFIGAADLLYQVTASRSYYQDALRTLAFTKASLTVNGILKSEVPPGAPLAVSAGGYKGVFVRWAKMFINRYHVPGYDAWLQQNAAAVQRQANAAGLMNEDWANPTGTSALSAFSCSSAVVLLQWVPPGTGTPTPTPAASP
jgi:predicted alpha-1,6-mannanase (GH76 family)